MLPASGALGAKPVQTTKQPTATGTGGAVASQRNTATTSAEPAFLNTHEAELLASEHGHTFTSTPELGAVTGIAFLPDETVQAAAEPVRRGGGSALVENPAP